MKVAKFGGSSLSDAKQIYKVATIVKNNPGIKVVVVSAPGKRSEDDTKVTDLLIALFTNHQAGLDTQPAIQSIIARYHSIITDLNLTPGLLTTFENTLNQYLDKITKPERLLDALKSCGEDFNAQLISEYFNQQGIKACYRSPKEIGMVVTDHAGDAALLPQSYESMAQLRGIEGTIVVPGFYGYSQAGDIVTFSRGGSDITGAIIANAIDAEVYENYTDVSYIYSAHPGIIKQPHRIKEITYREMRELAYSGFAIFHDEALRPLYNQKIPVQIKNTNHPEINGTRIVADRDDINEFPVIGVSGDSGFMSFTIKQYLLNKEVGYTRKLLQIFEDLDISIEHIPTGIDDITIIVRSHQFDGNNKKDQIIDLIHKQLQPEWIHVEEDLAIIAVVGEGMRNIVGLANKATTAFMNRHISLQMINQGASELSMFFCIQSNDLNDALQELYVQYFN
ncbi:aspartate kinase [Aerococcaceae bacterium DSM 111020]|nr:aspartate kinase [Aerococcaceae bacterium DSM 111020]